MSTIGWLQFGLFAFLITTFVSPLGWYLARIADSRESFWTTATRVEHALYRLCGADPSEQNWVQYAASLVCFNVCGIVLLYVLQRLQGVLPFNPQRLGPVEPTLAMNTAVSFVTNTSWQSYAGETTVSYLVQMAGITVQSFMSAATGIGVAFALVRGIARHNIETIGNFWADLVRSTFYLLLPLSVAGALVLQAMGVPQTLSAYVDATSVDGAHQVLAIGPVASQEMIKLLSGDGGGFFNANSAHPFEDPTAASGLLEALAIFLIGAGLTNAFGRMVGDRRQGWVLYAAMAVLFVSGFAVVYANETSMNAASAVLHQTGTLANMEGKEVRFGTAQSSLFATVTTASSDGAVDSMHDSFMPLSGLVLMANMMLDEVIVGGPGSGLFGMLLFVIVAVFLAGLMIGRTPEYLGNKIEGSEVKMAMLALLVVPFFILGLPALGVLLPQTLTSLNNAGPHGFSEVLYAYASGAATNGSAFAGLNTNTDFYNLSLAVAMFAGRFLVIIPVLCVAGTLARKRRVPASAGTLPTHGPLFATLLVATIVIVGGLTFFPALVLGPVAEHLVMLAGGTF